MNWIVAAIGGAVIGGVVYALAAPEKPCAVAWSGPLDQRADAIISALVNAGFTISSGRLKQDVREPYASWEPRTTTLLVKPSELAAAKDAVTKAIALLPAGSPPMAIPPR
jgi:hypothetical protein